jgi:uncharacterized protein with PQ loop repeat
VDLSDLALADVLGIVAMVAFLVRLVPQPVRLARTGVPDGVSPMTAINIALTEVAWLVYGLIEGLVPVWLVSVPALPLALWTVVLLRHRTTRRDLLGSGLWLAVIAVTWGAGVLGIALALSVLVNYGPQVVTALRDDRLDGLAPATWWLAIVDAATWSAYGLAVADPELLLYGAVLATSAVIILVRIRVTSRTVVTTPALAVAGEAR